MMKFALKLLSCPVFVLWFIFGISLFSLATALTAQFVYDLEPCVLCLYQRVPFVLTALMAAGGLFIKPMRLTAIGLSAGLFLINAGIAFYHVGVEQSWWVSAVEGCGVPSDFLNPAEGASFLDQLMKTPAVSCRDVAWIDPIFGMSMAFYNIVLNAGMLAVCALSLLFTKRSFPSI